MEQEIFEMQKKLLNKKITANSVLKALSETNLLETVKKNIMEIKQVLDKENKNVA